MPFGQLQGNFSVVFYHAKGGGKGSPIAGPGNLRTLVGAQWAKSTDYLEMQHFKVPDEAKKPPCLPVYWYTMSEDKLIQFRNLQKGKIG